MIKWLLLNKEGKDRYTDQGTGVTPSYCGQCPSTCRGCLKEQLPNHPLNNVPTSVSL